MSALDQKRIFVIGSASRHALIAFTEDLLARTLQNKVRWYQEAVEGLGTPIIDL